MVEFVYNHPDYVFFVFLILFLITKVILDIIKSNNHGNEDMGDDDDGGVYPDDPILDLPPGVTLPKEEPEAVY